MKIKKFRAKTFSEALILVKREFGEDALILSTEERKGIRPSVEITAAIDYEMGQRNKDTVARVKQKNGKNAAGQGTVAGRTGRTHYKLSMPYPPAPLLTEFVPMKTVCPERTNDTSGHHCKTGTEGKKNSSETEQLRDKQMILHFLMERSVREEFALRLCDRSYNLNDIPSLLSTDIRVRTGDMFSDFPQSPRGIGDRKAVMLIGPTGVGKTTTLAKLSAHAVNNGKRVGIISLDTYRIGAVEQIRIYANIMGIPLLVTSTPDDLKTSLLSFAQNRDIIFIDTSGRNPKDEMHLNMLFEITQIRFPIELHLLMSANCDDECMIEAYRFYRKLPIDYISFTKVDEAVRFGSLYNLLLLYQKPVAYITTGQKVPDDIEFATSDRLVNLILKKG